ncbi:c-type cytochrome [Paucibacter sp. KCTC 42545]|uniref:c-type cytochrome n=1 Tax=Paucibacter sp. KCTC 42545 TaxID=1768242 RepID=UPI000733A7C5|nr:cytochrome c [Paucibacter sp. KCTC 42545]ALT79591.1 cytochrome C [Paucibacter sp. KCTC 42545]
MNRWLKRGAWLVVILLLGLGALVAAGLLLGEQRAARRLDIMVAPVALRSDAAAIERGAYLYGSRGCVDCHGANGAGATLADDGKGLKLAWPNLTTGSPRMAAYQAVDWVRSIRHGVGTDGRALRLMPSEDYNRLTDADLASLVAYVRQFPAQTGREQGIIQLPLPGRVMYGLGKIPEAAMKIDHSLPPSTPVAEGVSVEHGAYIAQMCVGCHRVGLRGGNIVGAPPDWPAAARLAPGEGSVMPLYQSADVFLAMMRSGKREDGSTIAVMPFSSLKTMNDTDLRALHLYLKQLTAS